MYYELGSVGEEMWYFSKRGLTAGQIAEPQYLGSQATEAKLPYKDLTIN